MSNHYVSGFSGEMVPSTEPNCWMSACGRPSEMKTGAVFSFMMLTCCLRTITTPTPATSSSPHTCLWPWTNSDTGKWPRLWVSVEVSCPETKAHACVSLSGCHTLSILEGFLQWLQSSTWRWTAFLTSTGAGGERMMTLLPGKAAWMTGKMFQVEMWDVCRYSALSSSTF